MKKLILLLFFIIQYYSFTQISIEVPFRNDTIVFSGTLQLPDTIKKYPLIIMVTGSGPQNRDEEIFGFKIFKLISDSLNKYGFATYRYDDRGTAKSKGKFKNATTLDFAYDANSALLELSNSRFIDKNNIGIFGHSEGGIIAPIVANLSPNLVKFIISMAGPTVNGNIILRDQMYQILKSDKVNEEIMNQQMSGQAASLDYALGLLPLDSAKKILVKIGEKQIAAMDSVSRSSIKDPAKYLNATIDAQLNQLETPWMKQFIKLEPFDYISKICGTKILALYGSKDTQVPAELNINFYHKFVSDYHIDEICPNFNFTYKIIKDANHLFQKAETGSPNEYGTLKKEFCNDFIFEITSWLKKESISK